MRLRQYFLSTFARPIPFGASAPMVTMLLLGLPVYAQEAPAASSAQAPTQFEDALHLIDVWLEAQAAYDRVPALSAGVVVGEELVWKHGYGAIDKDRKIPTRADTIYGICSISKLFTSIAVMQLWEAGKLSLDEDIGKALPSFDIQRSVPDSGPITIRSLLTHSSGLPREADFSYWPGPDFNFPTRDELLKQLGKQRTFMRASDRWQYSNLGMAMLGEMVAEVSGVPYADFVRANILEPLKLSDTRPTMPVELYGKRLAQGFGALKRDGTRDVLKLYDARGLTPAAGFSSTVEDLARFASWQFRLRKAGGKEILQAATLRDMQRVQWIDADGKHKYGLGFETGGREGPDTMVGHKGWCPGYQTWLRLSLKDEVAVVLLTNATDAPVEADIKAIMDLLLKGLRLPVAPNGADSPKLASYAGRYSSLPWASEEVVVPWGSGLAIVDLPEINPAEKMVRLRHVSQDTFRVVRDDDSLAEEVVFHRNETGQITGYKRWSQWTPRLTP